MSLEPTSQESAERLFLAAQEIDDSKERERFLMQRSNGNSELRASAQRMLEDAEQSGASMDPNPTTKLGTPAETQAFHFRATPLNFESASEKPAQFGRFEIRKLIGHGGMGSVFLARDTELERNLALKFPRMERITNPVEKERFFREARLAGRLSHPNLVTVYEVGVVNQTCFIASEWFERGDLANWLTKHPGPHDSHHSATVARSLARAIAYCHEQGVVHLDIKPANIILADQSGDEPWNFRPMLTDFGIARAFEGELSQTESSMMLGTPLYMAPEQAACDRKNIGPRSDIYSLGVVLYELLYGKRPFETEYVMELLECLRTTDSICLPSEPSVPDDLQTICLRCLAMNPEERYPSASAVADDLDHFLDGKPIQARRDSWRDGFARWIQKPKRIQDAAAGVIFIQCILAAWVILGMSLANRVYEGETLTNTLIQGLLTIVAFSIPLIFFALKISKGHRWAIICALTLAFLGQTVVPMMVLAGSINMLEGYYEQQSHFEATNMGLVVFSGITQTIILSFALCASQSLVRATRQSALSD